MSNQTATITITETGPDEVEFNVKFDPPLLTPQEIRASNAGRLADIAVGVIDRVLKAPSPEEAERMVAAFGIGKTPTVDIAP